MGSWCDFRPQSTRQAQSTLLTAVKGTPLFVFQHRGTCATDTVSHRRPGQLLAMDMVALNNALAKVNLERYTDSVSHVKEYFPPNHPDNLEDYAKKLTQGENAMTFIGTFLSANETHTKHLKGSDGQRGQFSKISTIAVEGAVSLSPSPSTHRCLTHFLFCSENNNRAVLLPTHTERVRRLQSLACAPKGFSQ